MAIVDNRPARALHRATRVLVLITASACGLLHRQTRTQFEPREVAIYRVVAESLYLTKAGGRAIGVVAQVLDTACDVVACTPLERRWGLDSLWWARDDRALALALKGSLLAQAGQHLAFGSAGVGHPKILTLDPKVVPGPDAELQEWRAFQSTPGAVAVLRFSPVGFSRDGTRALVITQMRCGPRCGHWLGASLTRKRDGAWTLGDVLLISSDR